MLRWQCAGLEELSAAEVYAILAARSRVFVVEQACAYQDADGYDVGARHWTAWSAAAVAAYLRVLEPGTKYPERSIGRVFTAAAFRRTGLGRQLLARALGELDASFPREPLRIGAQAYLQTFYESFGFVAASASYLDDGIPHIDMLRCPKPSEPYR
jgi:ElaA protein